MTNALYVILDATERAVAQLRARRRELERAALGAVAPSWTEALAGDRIGVIAELKRRSPSGGAIALHLDPRRQASAYASGGAAAISVLTEGPHFGGSVQDLRDVATAVSLPVLRKDFLIDPLQLYEARAAGASAVLLIVRALAPGRLAELVDVARDLALGQLVEVHDGKELEIAVALQPDAIGVNSRDLGSLRMDPTIQKELLPKVPRNVTAVAESGLRTRQDVERVAAWGADAVLVGTALSAAPDPERAVRALCGVSRRGR